MEQFVVDVSEWQGWIDWEQVKASGAHAILRCGYGSDFAEQDDRQFSRNLAECERLGIPHGVYLYSYAHNDEMARSEAAHVLRLIEGHALQYPVYFDSEESGTEGEARTCAVAFCEAIEAAGYWAGIYASAYWWQNYFYDIDRFTKWVAHWGVDAPAVSCDLWQYSSDGSVAGIDGRVDVNVCWRDFPAEIAGVELIPSDQGHTYAGRTDWDVVNDLALEVIAGQWGNGEERAQRLGFLYEIVQSRVNEILG